MNSKPSKSARKRETLALQTLGERLIELAPEQLASIGLDEALLEAILAAKSIRAHGALRRQKQLIGKLMRGIDPAPVAAALEAFGSECAAGERSVSTSGKMARAADQRRQGSPSMNLQAVAGYQQ